MESHIFYLLISDANTLIQSQEHFHGLTEVSSAAWRYYIWLIGLTDKSCYYLNTLNVKRNKYFPALSHPDYSGLWSNRYFRFVVCCCCSIDSMPSFECLSVKVFCLSNFTFERRLPNPPGYVVCDLMFGMQKTREE